MKALKIALLAISGLIVTFVLIGFLLPSRWKVERSIVINAPAKVVYPLVANFKAGWPQWSGFDTADPDIQYSYSGPDAGVGASRSWVSQKMGNGFQKIVKADPNKGVEFELGMEQSEFIMNGRLVFESEGKSTKVTWTDEGKVGNNPFHRYLASLMNKMMGPVFEKSLATLKEKVEKKPTGKLKK
jgi:hypothetical protein